MTVFDALLLIAIMLALAALPSASVALVLARTATAGLRHGLAVALGIALADALFVVFAALGLSVVADYAGPWFFIIKILGGAYVVWLGYRLFTHKESSQSPQAKIESGHLGLSVMAGFLFTLGDIKAIVFYASILPLILEPATLSFAELGVLIGITLIAVGGVKCGYALLAQRMVDSGARREQLPALQKWVGALLMGAGVFIAVK